MLSKIESLLRLLPAWQKFRYNKKAEANWQFTTEDAGVKLLCLYSTL